MRFRVKLSRGSYRGARGASSRGKPDHPKGILMELHLPEPILENTEAMERAFEAAHQLLLDHYQGGVLRGNPVSKVLEIENS